MGRKKVYFGKKGGYDSFHFYGYKGKRIKEDPKVFLGEGTMYDSTEEEAKELAFKKLFSKKPEVIYLHLINGYRDYLTSWKWKPGTEWELTVLNGK
jgi:hypothetical protein